MSDNLLALVLERDKEIAALREAMELRVADINHLDRKLADTLDERDRLREALETIAATGPMLTAEEASDLARAALAKEAGQP